MIKIPEQLPPGLFFSNLNKVLYPGGFTKRDVLTYYHRIAPIMLPHLRGRGVTFKRYPNGVMEAFFFEKNCPSHHPAWVRTTDVARSASDQTPIHYCLVEDEAGLLWAANLAALELHVPMARAAEPDRPTAMVLDLDPGPPATAADCAVLALRLRDALAALHLKSFIKSSGGKGLHLYVPLNHPQVTSEVAKTFAHTLARLAERQDPRHVTATMAKKNRVGKVFIDWSQNDRFKTTVCPYSLRAQPEPRVSAPLRWAEVQRAAGRADAKLLHIVAHKMPKRIDEFGDLFGPVLTLRQKLPDLGA